MPDLSEVSISLRQGEPASHGRTITRGAAVFAVLTFLSRILGLIRDMLFANIFGISIVTSAFMIAYQIPNSFRRLFGEGALSGSFVPVFSECIHEKGEENGFRLANSLFTIAGIILGVIVLLGLIVYGLIGIYSTSEIADIISRLGAIMLPYLFFICLAGLSMGVLNTFNHFAMPAFSPALLNIVQIIVMGFFYLNSKFSDMTKAYLLSVSILIGGMFQLGIQIPVLNRKGFRYKPSLELNNPYLKKVWRIFLPGLFSLAVTQINTLLDSVLSVIRNINAPTELAFANRLLQLPMGIFGVSLAAATLPALSKLYAAGKIHEFKKTFSYSLRQVFAVSIPSSVGLIVLAVPIYALLFEHGRFSHDSTVIVARVMICYTTGLFAYSAIKVIIPAFLAMQDSKTPMKLGIISTLLNLLLNISVILTFPDAWKKYISAAFATTTAIAGFVYLAILVIALQRRIGHIGGREILSSFLRILASSIGMGVVAWLFLLLSRKIFTTNDKLSDFFQVVIPVSAGIISYAIFAMLLNVREFKETFTAFSRKMRKS